MTKRFPDWPVRLNAYIAEVKNNEFQMGTHDCCTFAGGAIKAMTGEDPMKEFRGKYDSVESGDAALKEIGHGSLYRTLCKKFGFPLRGAQGQVGDLVFFRGNCGIMLGRYGMFLTDEGISIARISQIQRAFRIGEQDG